VIDLNMPEATYHAHPALSSTGARRLLDSPAKFRWAQTHPEPPRAAFDLGHAVHSRVLGVGAETVAIPDDLLASNGAASTKAAKDWIEQARAEGKTPVKAEVFETVSAMADAVLMDPDSRPLFEQPGNSEVSVFATDPETGVDMRARFDRLADETPTQRAKGIDLKSARDASPIGFERAVAEHRYFIQDPWYLLTYELATGRDDLPFIFVAVEKEPPFLVGVHVLSDDWASMGRSRAADARRLYRECIDTGHWPKGFKGINVARPPTWLVAQYQEYHAHD
jgi:hypothetical protein